MDDENFLKLVEQFFQEFLADGMKFPEDELWDLAKRKATLSLQVQDAVDISRRDGKDYWKVLNEQDSKREKLKIN